ncbi:hypothetical protein ACLOJK_015463 [Asimina triloba]
MVSEDYDEDFPSIIPYQDMTSRISYRHTIPDPSPEKPVTPAEACLNWANKNALVQNKVLRKIEHQQVLIQQGSTQTNSRLDLLQDLVRRIDEKVESINAELYSIVLSSQSMAATAEIMRNKEMEKKSLQYQLNSIQMEVQSLSPQPAYSNFPWSGQPLYTPNIQPQPLLPSYSTPPARSSNPLFQPQQWRPKPCPTPTPVITESPTVPVEAPTVVAPTDKGKRPLLPTPEYIPELTEGASARLPENIFPIEEPNPISSFFRATALREYDTEASEEERESVYMADPGPSVRHPDEPTPMQQDIPKPSVKPEQFTT